MNYPICYLTTSSEGQCWYSSRNWSLISTRRQSIHKQNTSIIPHIHQQEVNYTHNFFLTSIPTTLPQEIGIKSPKPLPALTSNHSPLVRLLEWQPACYRDAKFECKSISVWRDLVFDRRVGRDEGGEGVSLWVVDGRWRTYVRLGMATILKMAVPEISTIVSQTNHPIEQHPQKHSPTTSHPEPTLPQIG